MVSAQLLPPKKKQHSCKYIYLYIEKCSCVVSKCFKEGELRNV